MNEQVVSPGDRIICRGVMATVQGVVAHPPGVRPNVPIVSDYWAVEIVTDRGSRYFASESAPIIGADLAMHWDSGTFYPPVTER